MNASALAASSARVERAEPIWPRLAPGIFLLLWSGGFVAGKIGVQYAEPFTLLTVRYLIVLAILAPIFLVMRPALPKRPAEWVHLIAVGLMIQGGFFCFCYAALTAGASAGTVALISSLQPIVVALLAPVVAGEGRVTVLRWLGLVLGLSGAALVITAKSAVEVTSLAGLLFSVGCLASMTGGTLWEKRFGMFHHPVTANTIQCSAGLAVTAPLALALEDLRVDWTGELTAVLAYLVLANSLISITLLLAMLRRGQASRVSALFFLVPPVAALLAWVMLNEAMPPLAWAGMMIAAAGVALALQKESIPASVSHTKNESLS